MYTVKQLSRLAGITPRTVHYYDQIGLLKPTQVGENGYRYYGEKELLLLQQILLYRELEMPLESIKDLLGRQDFDVLASLEQHKTDLSKRVDRLQRLISTVDKTISYLKGEIKMSDDQLFELFSDEQQADYEKEAMEMYDPETVKASNKKWKEYTPAEKQRIGDEGNAVYKDIFEAIPTGPGSSVTQAAIERWRRHLEYFWVPRLEQLTGLADLYNNDPRFRANFDKIDPRLAQFMKDAVKIYVTRQAE